LRPISTTRPRPDRAANSKRTATVSKPPAEIEEDPANELPRRISGLARMLRQLSEASDALELLIGLIQGGYERLLTPGRRARR
jgi:hypothetical protein